MRSRRVLCSAPLALGTLALLFVGACVDGDLADIPQPPAVGQVGGFVTAEPSTEYHNSGGGGMDAGVAMPSADASAGPASDAGATPPSGREAKVEEAEIYRVHNDKLFYLNTYRGLLIFDIKDASKPKLIGRLPVYGYPIEMYFKGDRAFVLLKDALYLTQTAGQPPKFHRHRVSQLVTVDLQDEAKPQIVGRFDIQGLLREGLSRKVDDTIYVVSEKPSWYYSGWGYGGNYTAGDESVHVYSYDVSDPLQVKAVDSLELFKGGGKDNWEKGSGESRSFRGVSISATANALMVVERWQVYTYDNSGGPSACNSTWGVESTVRIVDISDASGKIRVHTQFKRKGDLSDQFKQTYVYDDKTKTGTYLGIFARNEWNQCKRVVQNELVAIDVTDGKNPKELSRLIFGKPNETVRGSVFDVSRKIVFAITARNAVDPLYAISFADLNKLEIKSEIDGLSGDMSVLRFIGDRKFLLAVGRDTSNECTGFDASAGWSSTKMAVSVIDVGSLDAIRMVQRRCVAVDGGKWQSSAISNNQDQAHKMLGMFSDDLVNLIAVPVTYYEERRLSDNPWGWWYERKSAVGMMTWDLSKYDPLLAPKAQKVLVNQATVLHPAGEVKRTIFLRRDVGSQVKRLMLTLSDTDLAINDVSDVAAPKLLSTLEIAPYVQGVYRMGSYVVEHVRHGGDGYWIYSEGRPSTFRVRIPGKDGSLDGRPAVASLTVGGVQTVLQQGHKLLLLRRKTNSAPSYDTILSDLLVVDFANPKAPKLAGRLEIPGYTNGYYSGCGMYDYYYYRWGYSRRSYTMTENALVLLRKHYEYTDGATKERMTLVVVDTSDAEHPRIAMEPKKLKELSWIGDVVRDGVDPKRFYIMTREDIGETQRDGFDWKLRRYFALPGRVSGGQVVWDRPINLPGHLVTTYDRAGQRMFLTRDATYSLRPDDDRKWCYTASCNYDSHPRLHLLGETSAAKARLDATHALTDRRLTSSMIAGQKLVLKTRREYPNTTPWRERDSRDRLALFDLSQGRFDAGTEIVFETHRLRQLTAQGDRLLLSLPGDGVLTLDIADIHKPRGLRFTRTLGWTQNIAFDKGHAWVASGYFGTQVVDLDKAPVGNAL